MERGAPVSATHLPCRGWDYMLSDSKVLR